MKKKALSVLMSLALVAAVFTGCGKVEDSTADNKKAESTEKTPAGTEDKKEETTPAADENKDSQTKQIAKENLKIGVIHITDPAEGSGYTYTHDLGIQGMQKNLGLEDSQIVRKNNTSDQDSVAIQNAIEECIEQGCNVIFATSWGYMDTVEEMAAKYPEVIFSHGTGYKCNGVNFNNYFGRIYQARYLSGIAAGMKTKSNKVGYVAAWGKENSEVTGGLDAFAMGVNLVNPDAKVYVKVTSSWYDPEGEAAAADALIALGCDVIGQHCDSSNPMTAAEKAGVFGVGYNSDMSIQAPKAVLTSAMWYWEAYYTSAVKAIIDGTWDGSNYFGGLSEGLIGLAPLSDLCAEGTAEKIEEEKAKIVSGDWDVFWGVIETNDGSTVGEEGKSLDDATITGGINWYFKNVVEN